MEQSLLRDIAEKFLQPLISGSRLNPGHEQSANTAQRVAFKTQCKIAFKVDGKDDYRLILERSQPFGRDSVAVSEKRVIESFVDVAQSMADGLNSAYKTDIVNALPRRVVAKALSDDPIQQETILGALDQLSLWAGQQYEGKPIAAAVGFDPNATSGTMSLPDFAKEPFSSVLSNGYDTLLTCSNTGNVTGLETLNAPEELPLYSPYRLGKISHWARSGRTALVLNRTGEILVFKDGELRFARRSGRWHFLTHEPVITQMGGPDQKELRKAVYATCLDASFARSGACIGITTIPNPNVWKQAVSAADLLDGNSTKAHVLNKIVAQRRFQELDRRIRQELVAIDGATLIDRTGKLLAVGAILKIPGGSTGGGRLAAAKALARFGVGIKVSQDGGITGYRGNCHDPKFTAM